MTKSVESFLESFDRLPDESKREAALEILKRSAKFDLPPLAEEALLQAAEDIFLSLDKLESNRG